MKFNATIFVEGDADIRFIDHFVKARFNNYQLKIGVELQKTKGKDSLHLLKINFQENSKRELTNLVIFDADENHKDRKDELDQKKIELSIDFEQFLFPNGSDIGDLETLLENIVNHVYKDILPCFVQFQECLGKIDKGEIRVPDRKDKMYVYASLLSSTQLAKEQNRNYLDNNIWNLNSDYLIPLYNFLKPYFIEE